MTTYNIVKFCAMTTQIQLKLGDIRHGDYLDRRLTRMLFNLSISSVSSFSWIRSMAFSDSSSPTRSNMAVFFALRLARETWDATLFFCLRVSLVFLAAGAALSPSPVSESKSLAWRFRDLAVFGDLIESSVTELWSLEVDGEGEDSIKSSSQLEFETEEGPLSIVEELEVASC